MKLGTPSDITARFRFFTGLLAGWVKKDRLRFHAVRSTVCGLEQHLLAAHRLVAQFRPDCVVIDPATNLTGIGDEAEISAMLTRLIDYWKQSGVTAVFTSLTHGGAPIEQTGVGVSSLMDTWLLLRQDEAAGDRKRLLCILKSRGMAHSSAVREFKLTDQGIQLDGDP